MIIERCLAFVLFFISGMAFGGGVAILVEHRVPAVSWHLLATVFVFLCGAVLSVWMLLIAPLPPSS